MLCCSHTFILLVLFITTKVNDHIWWLVRVTLVAAFGFFPKSLGGGRSLWMIILLQKECSLCGGGNRRWWVRTHPTYNNLICWNIFSGKVVDIKHPTNCLCMSACTCSHPLHLLKMKASEATCIIPGNLFLDWVSGFEFCAEVAKSD